MVNVFREADERRKQIAAARKTKALTLQELNGKGHIWVEMLPSHTVHPAIIDHHYRLGTVAVWCAGTEKDFLREADYGKTWLAYLDLPEGVTPGEKR